eukprot:4313331-Prymnesium_polylepis.1
MGRRGAEGRCDSAKVRQRATSNLHKSRVVPSFYYTRWITQPCNDVLHPDHAPPPIKTDTHLP